MLVYDRQCPVCDIYCHALQSDKVPLRLIDARTSPTLLQQITARGIDIDQNMVLKIDNRLYAGPEAIHRLALLTTSSSLFNRINARLFRSERRARALYPILRRGRNLLLRLLRRTKINNLRLPDNERF